MPIYKEPEASWEYKIDQHHNGGTPSSPAPITRQGAFNGRRSGLEKAIPKELDPDLLLDLDEKVDTVDKAVLQPTKTDSSGKEQFARKRDDSGKFTPAQNLDQQTTAQDDAAALARDHKLSQARQNDKKKGVNPEKNKVTFGNTNKGMDSIPMSGNSLNPTQPQSNAQVIGMTAAGMPIYDDPYHPDHNSFSKEDFMQASQLVSQTDPEKASIFMQLAQENNSPMERLQERQSQPGGQSQGSMAGAVQTMKSLNPFDWFFQQQHPGAQPGGTPGMPPMGANQNTMASSPQPGAAGPPQPGMPGMNPDQNKPQMPGMDPSGMRSGPKPGMVNTMNPGGPPGTQNGMDQFAGSTPQTAPVPEEMPQDPYNPTPMDGQTGMPPVPGLPPPDASGMPPQQGSVMQGLNPATVNPPPPPVMPMPGQAPGMAAPSMQQAVQTMAPPSPMGAPPVGAPAAGMPGQDPNAMAQSGQAPGMDQSMQDPSSMAQPGEEDISDQFDFTGGDTEEALGDEEPAPDDSNSGFGEGDDTDEAPAGEDEDTEEDGSSSEDSEPSEKKDVFKGLAAVLKKYKK